MEQVRHIENPFFKIFNIVNPDNDQLYSLMLRLTQQFFANVKIPTLLSIKSDPSKTQQDITAYTGASGYLILLLRLHSFFSKRSQNKSSKFAEKSHIVGDEQANKFTDPIFFLQMAQAQYNYLQKYIEKKKPDYSCFSYYISQVSVWVSGMHLGFKTNNVPLFRKNEERIIRCFHILKDNLGKNYWELLYGVAGFLYAILEIQKNYDKEVEYFRTNFSAIAIDLTNLILKHGIHNYETLTKTKLKIDSIPDDFRLIFYFGKSQYLGGAHGLGGNLNILLTALKYNDFGSQLKNIMNLITSSIKFLLKHLINGNFATKSGSISVKLVHFCHGASGIVTALCRFTQMFPQIGIQLGLKEVIETNLNHIWKYGVLKKGFGLCHGISGNAYAFISPSLQQIFNERVNEFRKKAQLFALLHQQQGVMKEISTYNFKDRMEVGKSDEPYSLMVGIAGDICFTMDVLEGTGHFPGYDI